MSLKLFSPSKGTFWTTKPHLTVKSRTIISKSVDIQKGQFVQIMSGVDKDGKSKVRLDVFPTHRSDTSEVKKNTGGYNYLRASGHAMAVPEGIYSLNYKDSGAGRFVFEFSRAPIKRGPHKNKSKKSTPKPKQTQDPVDRSFSVRVTEKDKG